MQTVPAGVEHGVAAQESPHAVRRRVASPSDWGLWNRLPIDAIDRRARGRPSPLAAGLRLRSPAEARLKQLAEARFGILYLPAARIPLSSHSISFWQVTGLVSVMQIELCGLDGVATQFRREAARGLHSVP